MSQVTAYECPHCGKLYKLQANLTKHIPNCSKNTTEKQIRDDAHKKLEEIRLNATSIPVMIREVQDYLFTLGIKLTFNQYPDTFNKLISNSHNAPIGYEQNWNRNPTKPLGYPGFEGSFKGTVEVLPNCVFKKKNISFSDLKGTWSDSVLNIQFFKTGSGSFSDSFNGSGMFFMHDFPKMIEEYGEDKLNYDTGVQEYVTVHETYFKVFHKERYDAITKATASVDHVIKQLTNELTRIKEAKKIIETNTINDFNRANKLDLPKSLANVCNVPSSLLADLDYQINNSKTANVPDILKRAKELLLTSEKYVKDNPELFI